MNIEVNRLPNCTVHLQVQIPPERVAEERARIVRAFRDQARIPGYRRGHVPQSIVERKFEREIETELRDRLFSAGLGEAARRETLPILAVREIKEVAFGPERSFRFNATLTVEPEFELPPYRGIGVRIPSPEPTDQEVDEMIESFRAQGATFEDVEARPLEMGDFAVLTSTAHLDDQPLAEAIPDLPPNISKHDNLWIRLDPEIFLPGFCAGLVGARPGESRTLTLDMPADLPIKPLAGKTLRYEVAVNGIKRRVLPELDDAFASQLLEGKSLAELREQVRENIRAERQIANEDAKRGQILDHLASQINSELPPELVQNETRRIIDDLVRTYTSRGVSKETLKEHEQEIVGGAAQGARRRLMNGFTLLRIARAEKIEVAEAEVAGRIAQIAERAKVTPAKLRKELEKRDALDGLRDELLRSKTLDFLAANATVTLLPPGDVPG